MNAARTKPDLEINVAVLERDLGEIKRDVEEIRKELAAIRGYFFKFLLGIGSLVGGYVVKWVLSGGLAGSL